MADKSQKNNKEETKKASKNQAKLIKKMLKEFELVYNLCPKIDREKEKKLKDELLKILT